MGYYDPDDREIKLLDALIFAVGATFVILLIGSLLAYAIWRIFG